MASTRKSFSRKFKAEVLKYITEKGYSNSAAARNFVIDEKTLVGGMVCRILSIQLSNMGFDNFMERTLALCYKTDNFCFWDILRTF